MIPSAHWDDRPQFFDIHYRSMFENFKTDFPMLNELEYRVLCLVCTQLFKPSEITDILRIGLDEYKEARRTMEDKIKIKGYNLNDLMLYARETFKIIPDSEINGDLSTIKTSHCEEL